MTRTYFHHEMSPPQEQPSTPSTPPQPPPPIANEDELLNNILPSYHMFQSTISKNLIPTNENYRIDPPLYEMTPINSATTSLLNSRVQSPIDSLLNSYNPMHQDDHMQEEQTDYNQQSDDLWKNTILANVDKLPNLTNSKGCISEHLDINIVFTEKVGQKGVEPTIIDPSTREFIQGDYIHGYVTFLNKSNQPVPFDMVYVVFEGTLTILDSTVSGLLDLEKPATRFKFLNMLDLFASWSYANIDRLITDNGDPHDWCDGETDPYDNTLLAIDVKRLFQPNVTYKRFFTFRIPEKLLDNTCEEHCLPLHCEIPPTLGIDRITTPPSVMLANKENLIRDLASIDSSISYSVDARIIGKASDYKYPVEKDQYVVSKLASCPIRVIPLPNLENTYLEKELAVERQVYFKAFLDTIINKIEYGHELLNQPVALRSGNLLTSTMSNEINNDGNKLRQLYDVAGSTITKTLHRHNHKPGNSDDDDVYQYLACLKKKTITGNTKHLGIISLSSIKNNYYINYTPPARFSKGKRVINTEINIPIELTYFIENLTTSKPHLPEIKAIDVEIVCLTIRSKRHPIPIEFTPDMFFPERQIESKNSTTGDNQPPNFDAIIIKEFQKNYLTEFHRLIKELSNDVIRIETKLYRDVKSLASLKTKYINLPVSNLVFKTTTEGGGIGSHTNIKTVPWKLETSSSTAGTGSNENSHALYTKKFTINLDLNNCSLKGIESTCHGLDQIVLVPSFQSCLISRVYYLKVCVKMIHGENLIIHVPLTIQR
ncbi:uncharacterized protein J8A68_002214 [[Candida] subhashii]|uniref:Bul1 N-terminal domain-containing protein n=1 Tax=[Candida] subhashii TaxID=561895 RepID=A0A8J5QPM8_9ASCO|nr:uncharacterized protein J8A68_002214 [[Candida] subhashii]KAG7664245.1 hypothetical protein J8A68_002214 [[Candida] subhashii]